MAANGIGTLLNKANRKRRNSTGSKIPAEFVVSFNRASPVKERRASLFQNIFTS